MRLKEIVQKNALGILNLSAAQMAKHTTICVCSKMILAPNVLRSQKLQMELAQVSIKETNNLKHTQGPGKRNARVLIALSILRSCINCLINNHFFFLDYQQKISTAPSILNHNGAPDTKTQNFIHSFTFLFQAAN